MAAPTPSPEYYRLVLTSAVEEELDALDNSAFAAGRYDEFAAALDKLNEILRVYPQHGNPFRTCK